MTYQTVSFIVILAFLALNYVGWTIFAYRRSPGNVGRYWPMHLTVICLLVLLATAYAVLPWMMVYGL